MAKVRNADPITQKAAFDATISTSPAPLRTRSQALRIDAQPESEATLNGLPIHRAGADVPPPPENGLRLGWGERGMFLDQRVGGEIRRSTLFGASYGLPQLLESRLASYRSAIVEFDSTLDAATRDAVIDNFLRERPAAAAGGGGKGGNGNGGWRVADAAPEDPDRNPRLIIFRDKKTGKSQTVLETTRGRMEIVIKLGAQGGSREGMLKALSKRIKDGASFELSDVKIVKDGAGARAAFADFTIQQGSPIDGSIVGFVKRVLEATNKAIADAFSGALRRAFKQVTSEGAENGSNGDLLIEFQSLAMETGFFRRVSGKVLIDDRGMRWILFVEPNTGKSGTENVEGQDM